MSGKKSQSGRLPLRAGLMAGETRAQVSLGVMQLSIPEETHMKRHLTTRGALISAITLGFGAAHAAEVIIEPDNYSGDVSNVAPGATLSTFRNGPLAGYQFTPVYSVIGGNWAPTGTRVFGHRTTSQGEPSQHWESQNAAYSCEQANACGDKFYVFRVDFDTPTTAVSVLSTLHGIHAIDPVELSAFNANGDRILRCRAEGVGSLPYPAPRYVSLSNENDWGARCGAVLAIKNCVVSGPWASPANCDYVVSLNVRRVQSDIAYVMFAGVMFTNTFAPVDQLRYNYIPLPH
jgi:hypothetical protein